jgi:GWxTD domain-containing protein
MKNRLILGVVTLMGSALMLAGCSSRTTPSGGTGRPAGGPSVARPAAQGASAQVLAKARFLDNRTSLAIFLNLDPGRPLRPEEFVKQYAIRYSLLPEYGSRQELASGTVPLTWNETVFQRDGWYTVRFEVAKPPKEKELYTGVVLCEITDLSNNAKATADVMVRFQSGKVGDYFAYFDATGRIPVMSNYAQAGDTLQIRNLAGTDTTFLAFHYTYEFDPALPPMATGQRPPTRQLFVDSSARVSTNVPFALPREGLYYAVRDTSANYGLGLVVADDRYPRLTRPEKLVRPLVYMSTNQEINDLTTSADAKRALDRYWLSLANGNQQNAKRSIRAFYRRVEQTNRLFTSYKEGWKTDRGMVFIIMGPPNRVQRTRDKETWVYTRRSSQFSEINFTFNKRANQFVEDHYELSRFVEFQPIWYPAVEAWRTGEIDQ